MKKNTFFLFLFVSLLTNAQSFTLKGTVVDEHKNALENATVRIIGLKKATTTNAQGLFEFLVPNGKHRIKVRYLGYQSNWKEAIINEQNSVVNFILNPQETALEEVLVSAVRATANAPVTFSNLSKKEIEKRNLGQDIPILLNYMPSVVSSSDAGNGIGYTYMNVRGSNGERINVTVNGIPYNDAESHGTFWVNLSDFASSTENLQLQRGVGTSTNGAGAFGASLNILTDAISEEASGEISNSFGSFGTRKHTLKFSTGKLNEHIEIAGRLSNIYSDGYVDRAFADLKSYYLQGSYTDENTLIKAITFGGKEQTYQAWEGLTAQQLKEDRRQNPYTYENEIDDYNQNHYQLHWNEKLSQHWSTNVALNYTKGSGFFEQFKENETAAAFNNLIKNDSDVIVRRWLDNDFYVVNLNSNYTTSKFNLVSGFSYSNYTGDHFGEIIWGNKLAENTDIRDRYYFSDAKKTSVSVFTKATFNLTQKLVAYVDLQGRFINYKTQGITPEIVPINVATSFNFFNPKFGATYTLNTKNKLYASFAVANREPNRNDFENGVNTPETLHNIELGWRLNSEKTTLNTNIYYMDYTNQLVLTGALDDVGAPVRATSGSSFRLGLEIDAAFKISEKFTIQPNIAFSTNKNRNFILETNQTLTNLGNTDLSFSPSIIAGNIFSYQPKENFQISFLSKYVGKQFMSNLSSKISKNDVLNEFFTSDLNVVYELKPTKIFKAVQFTALLNNIFNKEYVNRGYYYTFEYENDAGNTIIGDGAGYYPQATRNFLIGVTLKL